MKNLKQMVAGTVAASTMAFGLSLAVPAEAQQRQTGLVNVQIGDITTGDILSENRVNLGVALQLAANVCGTTVQLLAADFGPDSFVRCENKQTGRFAQVAR